MKKMFTLRMITYSAMLVAIEIVLNRVYSINTLTLKIGFSFVPIIVAAYLYGPICAAVVYGLGDFIGAILLPIGTYHPGFTLCAAAMGLVYGLFLHGKNNRKISFFPNIVLPAVINNLVFGLVINTAWISMLVSSKTYFALLTSRITEYAILIPLNLLLTPIIIKLCEQLKKHSLA